MELLECLGAIATKLGISANEVLTLHCWNRGMLGKIGMRSAMAILASLAERYDFDDAPDAPTYGTQLVKKGILTPAEGYLFAGGYLLNAEKAKEHTASDGADAEATAFDGKA
jgi:hypothetical protein